MSRARFITLEGLEGAGKSTIAAHLQKWLAARGASVRLTREPGGTPIGERIRELVLQRSDAAIAPSAETLLMFAARAAHVAEVIRPALARGEWVLCDRFTDATRAYQGAGRGVDGELIERLAVLVHPGLAPDRTLLLDLPVAAGLARARGRAPADRFEAEADAYFERVRSGYLAIAAREPDRVRIIDASRPLAEVLAQATAAIAPLIGEG